MGTYIYSLYSPDGSAIDGTRSELQAKFSAEAPFAGSEGNVPMMYTALLNKKGVEDTVVRNNEY